MRHTPRWCLPCPPDRRVCAQKMLLLGLLGRSGVIQCLRAQGRAPDSQELGNCILLHNWVPNHRTKLGRRALQAEETRLLCVALLGGGPWHGHAKIPSSAFSHFCICSAPWEQEEGGCPACSLTS